MLQPSSTSDTFPTLLPSSSSSSSSSLSSSSSAITMQHRTTTTLVDQHHHHQHRQQLRLFRGSMVLTLLVAIIVVTQLMESISMTQILSLSSSNYSILYTPSMSTGSISTSTTTTSSNTSSNNNNENVLQEQQDSNNDIDRLSPLQSSSSSSSIDAFQRRSSIDDDEEYHNSDDDTVVVPMPNHQETDDDDDTRLALSNHDTTSPTTTITTTNDISAPVVTMEESNFIETTTTTTPRSIDVVITDRHDEETTLVTANTNIVASTTTPTTVTTATATTTTTHNRTLVIVLGNIRGGAPAWQSMIRQVLDPNMADLALLIGEGKPNNKVLPTTTTTVLHDRAKYIWTVPEFDDWADAMEDIPDTPPDWRERLFALTDSSRSGNILLGAAQNISGSGALVFMFRFYLSQQLVKHNLLSIYDRFVVTRSDHYYLCVHDLSQLSNEYLWVPTGSDYFGICDRHFIASNETILSALDVLPPLVRQPEAYREQLQTYPYNTERFLLYRWEQEGLSPNKVRRFDRMLFLVASSADHTRWKPRGRYIESLDVYLKYSQEYRGSSKTCRMRQQLPTTVTTKKQKNPTSMTTTAQQRRKRKNKPI